MLRPYINKCEIPAMQTPRERRSIRLPDYDYSLPGVYFVTLVVLGRQCLLGNIEGDVVHLSQAGELVTILWSRLHEHFPVEVDTYVVMPNHMHGILVLTGFENPGMGEACGGSIVSTKTNQSPHASPLQRQRDPGKKTNGTRPGSLGAVIQNFKSVSTRKINAIRNTPGNLVWQRNYYERIVRNNREWDAIRQYIETNPLNWNEDPERHIM
jgi:REP element-mobilizing transposase RayT